ncbi:MAG: RNA polymerase factor sigma-54 [Pseudomonadales bacterium]|jgi:RNA polymerase sigma-54 factor|nr:RNA polymerase factor sigma-54 [Pseudomonadales bacterium]MDP6470845.1 RNA polymerase factor sigma-54 [Pseudomonadales bacterium]MDP6825970.1 RNA polymerase factor sigma-54 [Pseudomonadales bacterium]MDP6972282.1 RNA polymerase factor sigma-54 [Pseudomonadales bacterium]|tara:strand:+ start:279 stop:1823 length:1545 start_codon:yes stop_codon:yes gene_type:complete
MKPSLTFKLGQQLTMTPQLQQAIRLLQLSALDLEQEIQDSLESNPMLELEQEGADGTDPDSGLKTETPAPEEQEFPPDDPNAEAASDATDKITAAEEPVELDTLDEQFDQPMPEELPVDSSWEDVYEPPLPVSAATDDDWTPAETSSIEETLQDHLAWQLNLTPMSDTDRMIGLAIIDAINTDGMLEASVEELLTALNTDTDPEIGIEADEIEAVLKRIQHFDPIGVAARSIEECLLLQLNGLPADIPWREEAIDLVRDHLDLLGAKDFNQLRRRTKLNERELGRIAALIQSLNPRPGSAYGGGAADYVIPDVVVRKDSGRWLVELNREVRSRLRINATYASLVKRADNSADNTYLKDNLAEARWFLKSLESRDETLLKVATRIVEVQRGFLEYGEEAMKPLILADIAEAVDMHESTISRVTNNKYIRTPRGIFELKYFFSSHVGTSSGGEVSSTAIRALIKKLTAEENPRKPLSDSKIAAILAQQNIKVARRTVAKYRESLAIPPSNERKQLV